MTTSDEIYIIANKLANQGLKPSVALVKSKLSAAIPLPKIIACLKSWQHDPNFTALANNEPDTINTETIQLPEALDKQLTGTLSKELDIALQPLKQELNDIKQLLQQLTKQQEKQ